MSINDEISKINEQAQASIQAFENEKIRIAQEEKRREEEEIQRKREEQNRAYREEEERREANMQIIRMKKMPQFSKLLEECLKDNQELDKMCWLKTVTNQSRSKEYSKPISVREAILGYMGIGYTMSTRTGYAWEDEYDNIVIPYEKCTDEEKKYMDIEAQRRKMLKELAKTTSSKDLSNTENLDLPYGRTCIMDEDTIETMQSTIYGSVKDTSNRRVRGSSVAMGMGISDYYDKDISISQEISKKRVMELGLDTCPVFNKVMEEKKQEKHKFGRKDIAQADRREGISSTEVKGIKAFFDRIRGKTSRDDDRGNI